MEIKSINWGNPKPSLNYNFILDAFSNTKINSNHTSSIPLAQYWKDYTDGMQKLTKNLHLESKTCELFFEYPTPSFSNNTSSFTDLMIFTEIAKIAIEAKYTEIVEDKHYNPIISKWLNEGTSDNSFENRKHVLTHWCDIIINNGFTKKAITTDSNMPYQFLHRTASACFDNKSNAFVVYQVFYDLNTKHSLDNFKNILLAAITELQPAEKLHFFFHTVEITNKIEKTTDDLDSLFPKIKLGENLFHFGSEQFTELKG